MELTGTLFFCLLKYLAKNLIDELYLSSSLSLDNKYFECKLTLLSQERMVWYSFLQQLFLKNSECGQHIELVYLLIFVFFELKNLETEKTKKRIRKTKEKILEKVKESIMIEEIVETKISKKTAKNVKSPEQAVEAVNNMEKLLKVKNINVMACLPTRQNI